MQLWMVRTEGGQMEKVATEEVRVGMSPDALDWGDTEMT
jgi:hypothetical protein